MKKKVTAIAGAIYDRLAGHLNVENTKIGLRKVNIVSERELERLCREYYVEVISRLMIIFAITVILSVVFIVKSVVKDENVVVKKNGYGGTTKTYTVAVEIADHIYHMDFDVGPLSYDEGQLMEVFDRGFQYIDEIYLGENTGADRVTESLDLVTEIPELGLEVSWGSDDYNVVSASGVINAVDDSGNSTGGTLVNLTAKLEYNNYSAVRQYPIRIGTDITVSDNPELDEVKKTVEDIVNSSDEEVVTLPRSVNGHEISNKNKGNNALVIAGLGVMLSILMIRRQKDELKEKARKRNDELMLTYPVLIDKLLLYLEAGLTVKGALTKLVTEDSNNKISKYLISELKYMLNEVNSGLPEAEGYSRLGARINLGSYMKLASLLSQNIRKGTKDILLMLRREEEAALLQKREFARKKGEEAGTKLLLPMILMLSVVMVIVVLPAFLSF